MLTLVVSILIATAAFAAGTALLFAGWWMIVAGVGLCHEYGCRDAYPPHSGMKFFSEGGVFACIIGMTMWIGGGAAMAHYWAGNHIAQAPFILLEAFAFFAACHDAGKKLERPEAMLAAFRRTFPQLCQMIFD